MAVKTKNFVFGDDVEKKTLPEFKAFLKQHRGVGAKEATEIYEEIHGKPKTISTKSTKTKQSKGS